MQTIEKINGFFKSIRNGISKTFDIIVKIKDILWFVAIAVISLFLISKCNSNNELEKEVNILTNNTYALTDSLRHYHDKLGNVIAEKHALQLTQKEMEKKIEGNSYLLDIATKKAKSLIENYINEIGKITNTEYEIEWIIK